jgi:modulator of FtsH protease
METLSQTADPRLAPPRPAANEPTTAAASSAARVLRNTYALLSMTLLFSGGVAAASVALALPAPGLLIALGGSLGLLYLVHKVKDSAWALPAVFAFTGFMGYTLGPLLAKTLALAGGGQIVAMALGATGITFLALSAWVLTTRRDFSFLGGFLFAGMVIAIIAAVAAMLMQWPTLALVVSAMVALLSAGLMLYETSRIVNGGETNYVLATVGLYVSIFNLFSSLLSLFGLGGADA